MKDIPYVITKDGMYYAHDSRGYVHRVLLAELYTKEYAESHAKMCDECRAIPITDLLADADEVQNYIDRLEVMRDVMKEHKEGE